MTYILDSNVLVYMLENRMDVLEEVKKLEAKSFFISAVSYFEVLVGAHKQGFDTKTAESHLETFTTLIFDRETAREALAIQTENKKQLKFKDLAIAATARWNQLTLVTADRDFKSIKGLKVKCVKIKLAKDYQLPTKD